jgi:hypothetical protein
MGEIWPAKGRPAGEDGTPSGVRRGLAATWLAWLAPYESTVARLFCRFGGNLFTRRFRLLQHYLPTGDICPRYDAIEKFARAAPQVLVRTSAVAAFSFFVRARNLCAAHLLFMQRRNREAGSRLRRPRGVMPERLFLWKSARALLT